MERNARAMAKGSPIMRHDLEESLERHAINPLTLSAFQRILLTTDGTVTEILEAFSGESIRVVKLFQEVAQLDRAVAALELPWGEQVLRRSILLQGRMSLVNFIYADSIIALGRLSDGVRDGLLLSKKGIGQLILEHRIESFREIIDCGIERAGELADHFQIDEDASLLFRTYNMVIQGQPVMVITEKFPEAYFRDWDPTSTRGSAPVRTAPKARRPAPEKDEQEHERVLAVVEQWVRGALLQDRSPASLTPTTDLMADGLLTPKQFFPLLTFIGERFGVRFGDDELTADNFRSLTTIADRIVERRGRRRG
jgi:chorismate-pyruvate lyase